MACGRNEDDERIAGEDRLIAEFWRPLAREFPGALGLQDDAALIAPPPGSELVVTTDALVAGVHFLPDADPGAVAWKALAVNVSDLIAKGAQPLAYLMTLALPDNPQRQWLADFGAGLAAAQRAFGCHLAGGDTDRTPGQLSVSITALGTVPTGGMVRRSGARPGDAVYVSGTIGDATLGLALLGGRELRAPCNLSADERCHLLGRISRPAPPLALIESLRACASAAMDVSDGLLKDFARLCRASGAGGRIEAARVPLSPAARRIVDSGGATLSDLITGGEDYEVLAAVPTARRDEFEAMATAAGISVSCIGCIEDVAAGITILDETGAALAPAASGFEHFPEKD